MASTKTFYDSPFGVAVHPWVNKADVKFNADGLFKIGLRLEGEIAQTYKAKIDAAALAAFDDYFNNGDGANATQAERKKFSVYYPYTVEEDPETGEPTGSIVFDFKQNATIRIKATGEVKHIKIGIYDAKGKPMDKPVFGGSEVRVNFAMRPIPMKSLKQVGVRLDFGRIQVKTLAASSGGGGFGAVEGYEDDGADGFGSTDGNPEGSTSSSGADY